MLTTCCYVYSWVEISLGVLYLVLHHSDLMLLHQLLAMFDLDLFRSPLL